MSRQEALHSADCFPIEFHDIAERRRVLYGDDFFAALPLDDRYYRAQVEHELRAKLIRLRQKAAGLLSERHLLERLMADSLSTFCVLARHALRLQGRQAPWTKRGLLAAFLEAFGAEPRAFTALLEIREGKTRPRGLDAVALFELYLSEIRAVIAAVDSLGAEGREGGNA
jgi:hypothetical protein